MKAEINLENKMRFFALYWGQSVIRDPDLHSLLSPARPEDYDKYVVNVRPREAYAQLKNLSSISDEDAVEVARLAEIGQRYSKYIQIRAVKESLIEIATTRTNIQIPFSVADFLRSKRFLIPWMGLSVEEIIEAGWAKYKEQ